MNDNKKTEPAAKAPKKPNKKSEGALVTAAKVIGTAAATVASTLGVHEATPPRTPPAKPAFGKLLKKNKTRLPRREKKALRRREQAASKS
jgi:hypothetical protein